MILLVRDEPCRCSLKLERQAQLLLLLLLLMLPLLLLLLAAPPSGTRSEYFCVDLSLQNIVENDFEVK